MEKKKLKLSITGSSKKTLSSIEQAKSKSKYSCNRKKRVQSFLESLNFQGKVTIILGKIRLFLNQVILLDHLLHHLLILKKKTG